MSSSAKTNFKSFLAGAILCALPALLQAAERISTEVDAAIQSGEFAGGLNRVTTWLNEKTPAVLDEATLTTLLQERVFRANLDQRQLIAKTGADKLAAFAKSDPARLQFLDWLLKNTPAMDLYLEGCVPIGLADREKNTYPLDTAALEIWARILKTDPDAREGFYLKLAIATAIAPPGSVNIGAGGTKTPEDPVTRYLYFKTAHRNQELFPSFDHLTVWEYSRIVSSGATDADLTWARDMINTFRPDLRADELVVNSTSLVWRRSAPPAFWNPEVNYGNFKNVLAGGGKCGPRSSWSQMVCHAFGIPAIGVGQPAHACVAYKAVNLMTQPQPGSAWKVGYGRGWAFSTLLGLKGPDFLAGVEKRSDAAKFSRVEHLRWLAAALAPAGRADTVMAIAHQINDSITPEKTDLTASLKPDEADADPGVQAATKAGQAKATPVAAVKPTKPGKPAGTGKMDAPIQAVAGVIHLEADAFFDTGGKPAWGGAPNVLLMDCSTGGRQIYFQQQMKEQWADYRLEVPTAGTYEITLKAAVINVDQVLEICAGARPVATVPIPLSYGLWEETPPVEINLAKGVQTLRVRTPESVNVEHLERGIALRSFDLKLKTRQNESASSR